MRCAAGSTSGRGEAESETAPWRSGHTEVRADFQRRFSGRDSAEFPETTRAGELSSQRFRGRWGLGFGGREGPEPATAKPPRRADVGLSLLLDNGRPSELPRLPTSAGGLASQQLLAPAPEPEEGEAGTGSIPSFWSNSRSISKRLCSRPAWRSSREEMRPRNWRLGLASTRSAGA